jgi:hypothetical protein
MRSAARRLANESSLQIKGAPVARTPASRGSCPREG